MDATASRSENPSGESGVALPLVDLETKMPKSMIRDACERVDLGQSLVQRTAKSGE
jgi:hypothetical protein